LSIKRRKFNNQKKEDLRNKFRINERIRVPEIRLVGDNLDEVSEVAGYKVTPDIYNTKLALHWANELGKDLVEISPKAAPPVCKIIDYSKFIYQQKKKQKELKDNTAKTVVKEIRFGPNTDDHDFNFKLNHAKKFLEDGNKVKAYVFFKGRTIIFKDRGELLLLRFIKELDDHGAVENLPKLEGKKMTVIISPKKKKKKK
jgi:translation initiation factor IF-3